MPQATNTYELNLITYSMITVVVDMISCCLEDYCGFVFFCPKIRNLTRFNKLSLVSFPVLTKT